MEDNRPAIPAEIKRRVLVEAGHRCAIPTCRYIEVDIHHIIPYEACKIHEYKNLIALCSNCHRRADRGDIDRKSLRIYKANLLLERAEKAEQEVQRLRKQLAWREVSSDQAAIIHNTLKHTPVELTMCWHVGDAEGSEFAQRLARVFLGSGLSIVAFAPMAAFTQERRGLFVNGSEQHEIELLSSLLEQVGLGPVDTHIDARKPDGTKYFTNIMVGYRVAPVF